MKPKKKNKAGLTKSRFLYLHPETNAGKIKALEDLQAVYTVYLGLCVAVMIAAHRSTVALHERMSFFPPCDTLSSQIIKNVRAHAVAIVSGWAASNYATTLRRHIKLKFKAGEIDDATRSALCIIGKNLVGKPSGKVTQVALDLYWSCLLDEELVGRIPSITSRCGMRMDQMTAVLGNSEETKLTPWWIAFSHLDAGDRRIKLPLMSNPYIKKIDDASKGVLARRDRNGSWRFEVVDQHTFDLPKKNDDAPRVAVDVGFNVMAATSDGVLLGGNLKPKFNALYDKIKELRGNRQRQNLKKNSKRLDRMEARLTGIVKSMAGLIAAQLILMYPGFTFVFEDLDLRGCRGAKRFAYRALYQAMFGKALLILVNPAYTSQMCPCCWYVSRANRHGIKFHCRSCGFKCHADVVGGINLLGRSEDKQIDLDDRPFTVRALLRERYLARRNANRDSSSGRLQVIQSPPPRGQRLTVGESVATNPA